MLSPLKGVGLYLCKNLTELLGGELLLDELFDSGVPGCPGTRFVVKLNQRPVAPVELSTSTEYESEDFLLRDNFESKDSGDDPPEAATNTRIGTRRLPEQCNVLFVDDDPVLRKLFVRKLKTVAPNWTVREAANGETALLLVEQHNFDLFFVDQYMASVERQVRRRNWKPIRSCRLAQLMSLWIRCFHSCWGRRRSKRCVREESRVGSAACPPTTRGTSSLRPARTRSASSRSRAERRR
jgi:hypothetical protein